MTIKSELLELTVQHGGSLRPKDAVAWAAMHPESALHRNLEWDDSRAAQAYRIAQVRQLIAIHVVSEKGVRQLVSLTVDRAEGNGYRNLDAVLRNSNMRQVLLEDALADLRRLEAKYGQLQELAKVWEEAESVAAKHAKRSVAQRTKPRIAKQAKRRRA